MRIIHFNDERWDSGLTDYALTLAAAQKKAGHRVEFWACRGKPAFKKAAELGLETFDCGNSVLRLAVLHRRLSKFGADIINTHTGSSHSTAAALCAPLSRGPALVRTRCDAGIIKKKLFAPTLWKRTSAFIAGNGKILENFRAVFPGLFIPSAAVYQGICDPGAGTGNRPGPGEHTGITVGMLGRLDPVKGHAAALEAAAAVARRHPDIIFIFAGTEKNIKIPYLQKEAERLGIGRNVRLTGFVSDAPAFMKSCDLGIIPSTGSEAVSRVALEWMGCGVPLVSSDAGSLPEIVKDGVTGIVVPAGVAGRLAEAVLDLLSKPDRLLPMGRAGRIRYENHFTPERFEKNTTSVYEKALDNIPR
ncbi:MAG: glycosyltransferase family 4 protein [bacterium]